MVDVAHRRLVIHPQVYMGHCFDLCVGLYCQSCTQQPQVVDMALAFLFRPEIACTHSGRYCTPAQERGIRLYGQVDVPGFSSNPIFLRRAPFFDGSFRMRVHCCIPRHRCEGCPRERGIVVAHCLSRLQSCDCCS